MKITRFDNVTSKVKSADQLIIHMNILMIGF